MALCFYALREAREIFLAATDHLPDAAAPPAAQDTRG